MASCPICGGEDFESSDGLYFCTECGTQSQDIRDELADFEDANTSRYRALKTPTQAKPKRSEVSPTKIATVRNFQQLLQEDARLLIQVGYDCSLKAPLKNLWFSYLEWYMKRMTDISSAGPPKLRKAISTGRGIKRRATTTGSAPPKKFKKEVTTGTANRPAGNGAESDEENIHECPHDVINLGCVIDRKVMKDHELLPSKKLMVVFLYLSLLYSKQTALTSDIIRLMESNKLKSSGFKHTGLYFEWELRPDSVQSCIRPFFHGTLKLPLPVIDYHKLGCHIMDKLLLPSSLHCCLQRLLQVYTPSLLTSAIHFDCQCNSDLMMAALIVILLKLIYRLDDKYEIEQSQFASAPITNRNTIDSYSVYLWVDWVHLLYQDHLQRLRTDGDVASIHDMEVIEDLSVYLEHCRKVIDRDIPMLVLWMSSVVKSVREIFTNVKRRLDNVTSNSNGSTSTSKSNDKDVSFSPRLIPILNPTQDSELASYCYLFTPDYDLKEKKPLQLISSLSSSLMFLLKVVSRCVGHTPEQLLAAIRRVEITLRRRMELATLALSSLVIAPTLLKSRKKQLKL